MEIWFLGTGAGRPSKERNVTSIALRLPEPDGGLWMFDAGEGTQHQMMRSPLKMGKLNALFITHLHGDHTFGIPGLLSTRSYSGGKGPLHLFGPVGIEEMVRTALRLSGTHIDYELIITEIQGDGVIHEDERFVVEAWSLDHRLPCYGYRLLERDCPGKLNTERLKALGVPSGPLYGKLKQGEDVELPDGTKVRAADVAGAPLKGRIIAIAGDTSPCANIARLAENADLLVHEATFAAGQEEKAHEYGHSTTVEAAQAAKDAGVQQLIMTHFSSRFMLEDMPMLKEEAQRIFPQSEAAYDLFHAKIARRSDC
ncbi:ribonuclease Z [Paenibacillus sp. FSL H8-0537]|uniref:ribonuclease Z n=1 Tax=Paenibacillus sp. FSL H8-0537 TaxID=2921399 RepID=UPI0031016652